LLAFNISLKVILLRRGFPVFNSVKSNSPLLRPTNHYATTPRDYAKYTEYPEIATHIKQAIDQVYNGTKDPKQALDEAAAKSAKVLGW
jgi:maltose-binding protein MalE